MEHATSDYSAKRKLGIWDIEIGRGRGPFLNAYVSSYKWSDRGFIYGDGTLRWDFPERIPAGVKRTAYAMLKRAMKSAGAWPPSW